MKSIAEARNSKIYFRLNHEVEERYMFDLEILENTNNKSFPEKKMFKGMH